MMYVFCSNNSNSYSSPSFTMFFYVKSFTPSDTCDCQIKSQPVHVYESVAYKKACNTEET